MTLSRIWSRNVLPNGSTDGRKTRPFWLFIVPPIVAALSTVIDTIGLGLAIDVDPVHEHLDQQFPLERGPGDVVEVHAGGRVVVPHPDAELLRAQAERLQQ